MKLARLQADYNAEQESKAKLQEAMSVLRTSYETKLSGLVGSRASRPIATNIGTGAVLHY